MEEQRFADFYRAREREVPREEKQRLFLQALDIFLAGDPDEELMIEAGRIYTDSNGQIGRYKVLEMSEKIDSRWATLRSIDLSRATLYYWPERSYNGMTYRDQVNLELHNTDGSPPDLFTMKAITEGDSYRIALGNRREIQERGVGWLEVSRADADRVDVILKKIHQTLNPGLAA